MYPPPLRNKISIIILFGFIFFFILWPIRYQSQSPLYVIPSITKGAKSNSEPGPNIDALRSTILTDMSGNQKEYLNSKGYITFLSIFKKQHQTMINNLIKSADIAVANTSTYSVTLKPQLPPSNDPHDYLSLSRYYWPDPNKPDGLPYIRKDGYPNPEFFSIADYILLRKLFREIHDMGFAYYFTQNETYVKKSMYRLKEWFLDEQTKMNPNLNYAGLKKGELTGAHTGVLDFHQVFRMFQAITLLRFSPLWDQSIDAGLREWMSEYYIWFSTSKLGRIEGKAVNNHGTFYDVQAIFLLEYLGRNDEAKEYTQISLKNRIDHGILPSGEQPHETARPTSWFYSIFNLQGLFMLAERCDHFGCKIKGRNGWNYEGPKKQSIQRAVDFLLPFALSGGEGWPRKNIKGFEMNDYVKILELSYIIYDEEKYLEAVEELRPQSKAEQAAGMRSAKWEDNYLCNLAMMTNRMLWTCLQ
ncbi:chondroitin AC/alginate lyase [Gigaspora margarita]|uniref:Chondroitin AC/alginate lyase n=1 Tax=Gigaspora margarita TaxID=4874 RepID=A0A8H3XGD3_GIGMA|nr:chondroitin AC/alginate lyase [Gigaspora margarita]